MKQLSIWFFGVTLIIGFAVAAQASEPLSIRYSLYDATSRSQSIDGMMKELEVKDQNINQEIRSLFDTIKSETVRRQAEELLKKWRKIDSSTKSVLFELSRDEGGVSLVIRAVDEDNIGVVHIPSQVAGIEKSAYRLVAGDILGVLKRAEEEAGTH